jgi:hypothetical protein
MEAVKLDGVKFVRIQRCQPKLRFNLEIWAPDMALYHSDNTHYDLLVKDDSRNALLGLLLGGESFKENENVQAA